MNWRSTADDGSIAEKWNSPAAAYYIHPPESSAGRVGYPERRPSTMLGEADQSGGVIRGNQPRIDGKFSFTWRSLIQRN